MWSVSLAECESGEGFIMKENKGILAKILNVLSIVVTVLLVPVIIVNVVMIAQSYMEPNKIPSIFGYSPIVAAADSMSPVFEKDSLVFIQDVEVETLKEGDIICYDMGEVAITHEIVELIVDEDGTTAYRTKGIANSYDDPNLVYPQQIEGKYIGNIPGAGGFLLFMQSPLGLLVFIVIPIILYFIYDVVSKKASEKQKTVENTNLESSDPNTTKDAPIGSKEALDKM